MLNHQIPRDNPRCSKLCSYSKISLQAGGTSVWFEQDCATQASKPLPILKGGWVEKGR